jgi:hypothetical protein
MLPSDVSAQAAEAQKLEDLTGMGVPASELEVPATEQKPPKVEKPQSEEKPNPESQPKPDKSTEEAEDTDAGEDDDDAEPAGKDDKPVREERKDRPAKGKGAITAIFSILTDLQKDIAKLKEKDSSKSEIRETVEETADEIKGLTEKYKDLDPEGLEQLVSGIKKRILADLEKEGKLAKDYPDEIKKLLEKAPLLEEYEKEKKAQKQEQIFNTEWDSWLPSLEKYYPNARASEKAAMRKLMDEISHSKEFHTVQDLDYIWFKNKSQFDAIGKVAKGSSSGEGDSKHLVDDKDASEEEDIDLDPENMTPEKMKAHDKQKLNRK